MYIIENVFEWGYGSSGRYVDYRNWLNANPTFVRTCPHKDCGCAHRCRYGSWSARDYEEKSVNKIFYDNVRRKV